MKPRNPRPDRTQEAPRAHQPRAPFERNRKSSPPAQLKESREPKPSAHLKVSGIDRSGSKSPPRSLRALGPGALINRRAADRLRNGYLWVYASDIESIEVPETDPDNSPPLLSVADSRGLLLGTALYSPSSQIALRMVSREAIDEAGWLELLATRLRASIIRRLPRLKAKDSKTDSCRLCFSEADEIPGLIIDKYGPLIIVQRLARGLHTPGVAEVCVRVLRELVKPEAILERPDPRIRELEGLPAPDAAPLWAADPGAPLTSTQFRLNGLVFHYDANSGQKTGAFLDQSANYTIAQQYAWLLTPSGRALDVCTYQGGFALHLARVCKRVTGIDSSRASLEVAERNLEANRNQLGAEVDWVEGDAFQILREWSDAGEKFDTIVLDPPAFAKSHRAIEGALRGYKELNLRALKMLRPGGLLVTCSCSHHVSLADLEATVASAAADAGRRVRLRARRGAAPDHPVVLNLPETEYLKCLVLEVE
ncbi:MAG: class I SAM-dependent rRNA methyltransferase [Terracidiphilus sp.]